MCDKNKSRTKTCIDNNNSINSFTCYLLFSGLAVLLLYNWSNNTYSYDNNINIFNNSTWYSSDIYYNSDNDIYGT